MSAFVNTGLYLWTAPCLWGHHVKSKLTWYTLQNHTCVFKPVSLNASPWTQTTDHITGVKEAASAFFILMSGWDGRCQIMFYYFLFSHSIAGINNAQGNVLIWSSDSESVCSLFSAPSHIWGHTLTVMACSSLSRTNSSVCSHRKVFIRIIRTFLSPRLVGSLVYLKQEL